jgi:hypothetical protein
MNQANGVLKMIGDIGLERVTQECGADVTPLVDGIQRLVKSLDIVQANIESAFEISDCATISPILNGVLHGATCKETVNGLAWMFGTTLGIVILGLIMVTLRAALYNATMRAAKRIPDPQREWREYKRYMSQFYENAHLWKFERDEGDLEIAPSFDTGVTSDNSSDDSSFDSEDDSVGSDDCVNVQFQTPCKRATFVEQIKTAEKIRDLMYVLDDELQPLSPPSFMNTAADQLFKTPGKTAEHIHDYDEELEPLSPPFRGQKAPQKSQTTLQRTTQRKVLV